MKEGKRKICITRERKNTLSKHDNDTICIVRYADKCACVCLCVSVSVCKTRTVRTTRRQGVHTSSSTRNLFQFKNFRHARNTKSELTAQPPFTSTPSSSSSLSGTAWGRGHLYNCWRAGVLVVSKCEGASVCSRRSASFVRLVNAMTRFKDAPQTKDIIVTDMGKFSARH